MCMYVCLAGGGGGRLWSWLVYFSDEEKEKTMYLVSCFYTVYGKKIKRIIQKKKKVSVSSALEPKERKENYKKRQNERIINKEEIV